MKAYTDSAKKVLDLAKKLAKGMNYNYVGTEHILAGLVKEAKGVAAEVLAANNVEFEKLRKMIEELISPGEGSVVVEERNGFSPRTQLVLDHAKEEAERFHSEKIGTEHILLACDFLENLVWWG